MVSLAFQPTHVQRAALPGLAREELPDYAARKSPSEIEEMLRSTRKNGYAIFTPLGLREASIAVPVWHAGVVKACLAQRYMLVADRGKSGHVERLRELRSLSGDISAAAEAESARDPIHGISFPPRGPDDEGHAEIPHPARPEGKASRPGKPVNGRETKS
jgi:hypothetical protein